MVADVKMTIKTKPQPVEFNKAKSGEVEKADTEAEDDAKNESVFNNSEENLTLSDTEAELAFNNKRAGSQDKSVDDEVKNEAVLDNKSEEKEQSKIEDDFGYYIVGKTEPATKSDLKPVTKTTVRRKESSLDSRNEDGIKAKKPDIMEADPVEPEVAVKREGSFSVDKRSDGKE